MATPGPPSSPYPCPAAMADEESERESVRTGESREPVEELEQDLSQLSLEELAALVEETRRGNAILKLQMDMFEKHVNRLESQKMATERHGSSVDLGQAPYGRGRRKSKSRIPTERPVCLTMEQKCDLVQRELEETKEEMRRMKESSERTMQNLQAVLEEADIRGIDIKKAAADFEKEIIKTITKKKGSVIASNKVLQYMEDKMRKRDALKEKFRLKNDSLKVQVKKMQTQLKQKEELGEALHEVDFQQLKIENAQFLEKIDERNQELLQLKMMVGSTQQALNFYKEKLQSATAMADCLSKDIAQRKESLGRIDRELILAEAERAKAEALNKKLRKQLAENKVPPVLNYVHETMALQKLEGEIKIWERKVEIAELTLQTYRSACHRAKMPRKQLHEFFPEEQTSTQVQEDLRQRERLPRIPQPGR
ncbi:coiled-coil domain-containing protein 113 isoform X1 [Sceloporus undulatus]|uniref:coiled-coil domain-containing protein 113 isoform X1 n=1 Tax=Sceloporus undulatus TaxID=8520 RepID=UPI001C4C30FB|nr:coiled-coil domain-containing protein 113 isoform X1 [Sceloporus undulatus]